MKKEKTKSQSPKPKPVKKTLNKKNGKSEVKKVIAPKPKPEPIFTYKLPFIYRREEYCLNNMKSNMNILDIKNKILTKIKAQFNPDDLILFHDKKEIAKDAKLYNLLNESQTKYITVRKKSIFYFYNIQSIVK